MDPALVAVALAAVVDHQTALASSRNILNTTKQVRPPTVPTPYRAFAWMSHNQVISPSPCVPRGSALEVCRVDGVSTLRWCRSEIPDVKSRRSLEIHAKSSLSEQQSQGLRWCMWMMQLRSSPARQLLRVATIPNTYAGRARRPVRPKYSSNSLGSGSITSHIVNPAAMIALRYRDTDLQ